MKIIEKISAPDPSFRSFVHINKIHYQRCFKCLNMIAVIHSFLENSSTDKKKKNVGRILNFGLLNNFANNLSQHDIIHVRAH